MSNFYSHLEQEPSISREGLSAQDIVKREGKNSSYLGPPFSSVEEAYNYHGANKLRDVLAGRIVEDEYGTTSIAIFGNQTQINRMKIGCSLCGHVYK